MTDTDGESPRRRRLAEELVESGLPFPDDLDLRTLLLDEIEHALRPPVHERRVFSSGSILDPVTDPATWPDGTDLTITRGPIRDHPLLDARRFADGLSSWMLRTTTSDEWIVFDRPAGSERDLVVLAEVFGATIVQRHPTGTVRVVGDHGVLRWEATRWHLEPPLSRWIDTVSACRPTDEVTVVHDLLEFAVHDLGARGIGAILVHRLDGDLGPEPANGAGLETRLPEPPPLSIRTARDLAPLRHALAQVDGAAVFDHDGVLRQLGTRLVPSPEAELVVEGLRGMRHTSGRRYSFDDPTATVIVVSEDGPVTVLRNGEVLGSSREPVA